MTTPQTPAGWYDDPDGSGGYRYWDGHGWTEHRAPAPPPPPQPVTSHAEGGGAHRRPDADEAEPDSPQSTQPGYVEHGQTAAPTGWPSAPAPLRGPIAEDSRSLLFRYLAVCAALLAVLLALVAYAAFFTGDTATTITATEEPTTSVAPAPPTTGDEDQPTPGETADEAPPPDTGEVTDGALAFTVHGIETASSVASPDAPVEQTAQGEYVIVHMTVRNVSDGPATFLGTFQKLEVDGTNYPIDDAATFFAGGGIAELGPGDEVDVAVAFDVPPGTEPDAIELHADPLSPGVEVPLT